jgi:protein-S-isoprenylcysteine O-methyltransferase Ste14
MVKSMPPPTVSRLVELGQHVLEIYVQVTMCVVVVAVLLFGIWAWIEQEAEQEVEQKRRVAQRKAAVSSTRANVVVRASRSRASTDRCA